MAGVGRPPKNPEDRVHRYGPGKSPEDRIKTPEIQEEIPEWDGVLRGPELPDNRDWTQYTLDWWDVWRKSPQAKLCTDTDWESMFVAAIIHHRIQQGVSDTALSNLSGELRKREGMFGASYEDRRRLGLGIKNPPTRKDEEAYIEKETDRAVDYFTRLNKKLS